MPQKPKIDFSKLAEYSKKRPNEVSVGAVAERDWMLQLPNGDTTGPYSENEIHNLAAQGRLDISALVKHPVRTNGLWIAIGRFANLRELIVESAKSRAIIDSSPKQASPNESTASGLRLKSTQSTQSAGAIRIASTKKRKKSSAFPAILSAILVPVSALCTSLLFVYLVRPDIIDSILNRQSGAAKGVVAIAPVESGDREISRENSIRSELSSRHNHEMPSGSDFGGGATDTTSVSEGVASKKTNRAYYPNLNPSQSSSPIDNSPADGSEKPDADTKQSEQSIEVLTPAYTSNWPFVRESIRSYSEELAEISTDSEATSVNKSAATIKAKAGLVKKLSSRQLDFHFVLRDATIESNKIVLHFGVSEVALAPKLGGKISIPITAASKRLVSAQAGAVMRVSTSINKISRAALAGAELVFNPAEFLSQKQLQEIAKARGSEVGNAQDLITIPVAIEEIRVVDESESATLRDWLQHPKMRETLNSKQAD